MATRGIQSSGAAILPTPPKVQTASPAPASSAAASSSLPEVDGALGALRLIRKGTVDLSVPLSSDGVKGMGVRAAPGTVVQLHLPVENGKVQFGGVRLTFSPALDASALGMPVQVAHAHVDKEGRLEFETRLFHFIPHSTQVGDAFPSDFEALVDKLIGGKKPSGSSPQRQQHAKAKGFESFLNLDGLKFQAKGVELSPGVVRLGDHGSVTLGEGNALDLEGGLDDFHVRGQLRVQGAAVHDDAFAIEGGQGGADLNVEMKRDADGKFQIVRPKSTVTAQLEGVTTAAKVGDVQVNASAPQVTLGPDGIRAPGLTASTT